MPFYVIGCTAPYLTILSPLVLAADLLFFLGGEVIGNIKGLADFLGGLDLDHVCNSLASNVKEGLDIEVVGSEDNLKQHLLVDLHELLVPLLNIGCLLTRVGVIIGWGWRVVLVMFAPFNDLLEDGLVDIGNGDSLSESSILSKILHHVLDEHGALSDLSVNWDDSTIVGLKGDRGCFLFSHGD
jgi:hypothetical protein